MADVIEQLSAADPELGHQADPVRPPAELLASIMDGTHLVYTVSGSGSVRSPKRRRRPSVAALAGFGAVLMVGAGTLLAINQTPNGPEGAFTSGEVNVLITSMMILQDGVVTEEEYRLGAEAVVVCLADAGFEYVVDFDDPSGHATYTGEGSTEEWERCLEVHLSANVSLGWSVSLEQVDLDELRQMQTAVIKCVERRTGEDFGQLTYDAFGYPTERSRQTRNAAFEYQDHQPWSACQYELGFLDEVHAQTKAILECVERTTGQDFGELTYDDSGRLTEEGQQTLRAASTYQSDLPWEACRQELGLK